jgi:hypothetical protein
MLSFHEFLTSQLEAGGFSTEDAIASFLPLARQVAAAHAEGKVGPLDDLNALQVESHQIWFEESRRQSPRQNRAAILKFQKTQQVAFDVVRRAEIQSEIDIGEHDATELDIGHRDQPITRPVYLAGYVAWEHQFEHHDPLTDTFVLGLILASLACGVDLNQPGDLKRFVTSRDNLFRVRRNLHPVVARAISQMTELDRSRRPQDLATLVAALENYGDQEVDFEFDLAQVDGFGKQDLSTRHQIVLAKLQERLFEISRRNRLLHFRSTMQTINLTQSSVPLSFDPAHIRPDQILTSGGEFLDELAKGSSISLNKYINFQEVLYAPNLLDRIRAESRRDQKEYGFQHLRLVLCFLRWANLKESPPERYDSPLVLLPVKLTKKKGIRDTYSLEPLETTAEVNPVVRYQFKQLYDIDLPESIDLAVIDLDALYDHMQTQIQSSEPAVAFEKIDRPRVELIHRRARRRLDQYRRRARVSGRGVRSYLDLDYSYDPANYHPLGLKLFDAKVRPPTTELREIVEETPRPRQHAAPNRASQVAEKRRTLVQVREGAGDNPFEWQFDLCNVTLGNIKYRKMSLVRDYDALVQGELRSSAFDATFSLVPRPVNDKPATIPPLAERFYVVPCDPTQSEAIARASDSESYIIQGPPGTGKSQTITNLIADYVARGMRVLFVCEKRAAIDVVYARLRAQRLADLCCLIHDSQADKKSFVMDLKDTYESFLKPPDEDDFRDRDVDVASVQRELAPLEQFDLGMTASPSEIGRPIYELLERLIALREKVPSLSALERERLPKFVEWDASRDRLDRLQASLSEIQPDEVFARHPLARLRTRLADVDHPVAEISEALRSAGAALDDIDRTVSQGGLPSASCSAPDILKEVIRFAEAVEPLAKHRQLRLLVPGDPLAEQFSRDAAELAEMTSGVARAEELNAHWQEKLDPDTTRVALDQARSMEPKLLKFLWPSWWRIRGLVRRSYSFSSHPLRPTLVQVLERLQQEHDAAAAVRDHEASMRDSYSIDDGATEFVRRVKVLGEMVEQLPVHIRPLHEMLLTSDAPHTIVQSIRDASVPLDQLRSALDSVLDGDESFSFREAREEIARVEGAIDQVEDFLSCLSDVARLPASVAAVIRQMPYDLPTMEAAVADRALQSVFRNDRDVARFDGSKRDYHVDRLVERYDRWLVGNAVSVRESVRQRFADHVSTTAAPDSQLDGDQKQFKKQYQRGRRELEHEFGKTMRYKSIRSLVEGDSGMVVKDLKPVWLMSPLSVSDTLPLETGDFDVTIFDEASQITLEEAVPSLFRAPQAIVVGDEMQLPPTDFFSAKRSDDEELALEEEGDLVQYDLASNSFLNHAGKNLASTMLGWHYRSRSESLISFSNAAFYQGRLLTVPEERIAQPGRAEIIAQTAEDAATGAQALLERPVSFHFMEKGVYDRRRNRLEADYIAHLVRKLICGEAGLTIGVVAFSEAQQAEIEAALERLGQIDVAFRERLEAEYEREEDGQFVGLLVKNLENIQGDERDVVVMSVCYGHGPDGSMRMNFGPINKSGGEKRLNVSFSRAKHHMALISSIQSHDITNDYNDGANCLKNYLRYAAALSMGNSDVARQVLRDMSAVRTSVPARHSISSSSVCESIAAALGRHGLIVDKAIGQSHFRCDLAVRRPKDDHYCLGILIDDAAHYGQRDLLEREMMRPRLLRAFGWQITSVLAKDWYDDTDKIVARLLEQINDDK